MRAALFLAGTVLLGQEWPQTAVERSHFQLTSSLADIQAFMATLGRRLPALKPYRPKGAPARTEAGKPLLAWRLPAKGPEPLRVYIQGNIHAGEVEGKDALQLVLRELAQGRHPAIRRGIELIALPAYNADGTDAPDPANRSHQPNPEGGVGPRENPAGLDLNRDMMKLATANSRWLMAMYRDFDPACVIDLHTTNGSYHGFALTHQAAWGTGGDGQLSRFNRRMLKEVEATLAKAGLSTSDYGNFTLGPDKQPINWASDFSSPNLTSNYPVLENRLGVLVETYVYRSFPDRVADNRSFILALLEWLAAHRTEVQAERRGPPRRWQQALQAGPRLPLRAELEETEKASYTIIEPIRDAQRKLIGEKSRRTEALPALVSFRGVDPVAAPRGYLVDAVYADRVRPLLEAHGLQVLPGSARPAGETVLHFAESGRTVSPGAFQGVFTLQLQGNWQTRQAGKRSAYAWTAADLDRALYVPVEQAFGRLAFYLLDPRSADGLFFWGVFHSNLLRGPGMWGDGPRFPVLAVGERCLEAPRGAPARTEERHED
jgi:hypothetical protein